MPRRPAGTADAAWMEVAQSKANAAAAVARPPAAVDPICHGAAGGADTKKTDPKRWIQQYMNSASDSEDSSQARAIPSCTNIMVNHRSACVQCIPQLAAKQLQVLKLLILQRFGNNPQWVCHWTFTCLQAPV